MERNKKLIKMMQENPILIDNHTNKEEELIGLVEFNNPDKGLGCCFNAQYFSVNACYENNGRLHCSQASIGGVLWGISQKDIDDYNESAVFEGGKIKCIHLPDGTKVYPSSPKASMFAQFFINKINQERAR